MLNSHAGHYLVNFVGVAKKDQISCATFQRGRKGCSCNALDTFAATLGKMKPALFLANLVLQKFFSRLCWP